jgi:hypothetical protein
MIDQRKIHPQVVADSMLGIVPSFYSVNTAFAEHIDQLKAAIESAKTVGTGSGRSSTGSKRDSLERRLRFLIEAREKLNACIKDRAGWIAFFYTDAHHRIVAIRFRKPDSHEVVYFKPHENIAGLFNHGLFTPYPCASETDLNELLIVAEGEFNVLQLQSLSFRYAEETGKEPGYVYAICWRISRLRPFSAGKRLQCIACRIIPLRRIHFLFSTTLTKCIVSVPLE